MINLLLLDAFLVLVRFYFTKKKFHIQSKEILSNFSFQRIFEEHLSNCSVYSAKEIENDILPLMSFKSFKVKIKRFIFIALAHKTVSKYVERTESLLLT